ncbi:MAG: DMT family transporter [Desulfovibrionales bacterium]
MDRQSRAYIFGLATVLLWSTVASAFKLSLRHFDFVSLLLLSSFFSLAALGIILGLQKKLNLVFQVRQGELLRSAGLGLLNPCLYYLVLFKAYDLLPAQEAQPLNYTWAITLSLLSIPLLKQRILPRHILALFVSYTGVLVISTHGDPLSLRFHNPTGAALALGSTVIWALYWIFNTRDSMDPVIRLFWNFVFGSIFVLAAFLVWGGNRRMGLGMEMAGPLYIGLFEMGITFVLWLKALKLSETTAKVGNLIYLSPFLSLFFIHYFLGEEIMRATVAGLVLIMAGILLQRFPISLRWMRLWSSRNKTT